MGYELWDRDSGNLIGDWDERTPAVALLRAEVGKGGLSALERFALIRVADGQSDVVAQGRELIALVEALAR